MSAEKWIYAGARQHGKVETQVRDMIKRIIELGVTHVTFEIKAEETYQLREKVARLEAEQIAHLQLRRDKEGLLGALREIDRHLQFFAHVEKRYKEVGKDKVAFDKCAEIRAAHEAAREAIAKFGGLKK